MWVEISEQVGAFSTEDEVVLVVEIADYSIPSGITANTLTEAGSLIVALAADTPSETLGPTADGQVWTADLSLPKKGKWAAQSGGGGYIELYNKSGANQIAGTVVIYDYTNNDAFTLTTTRRDRRVVGVLLEDINNNVQGKVGIFGNLATVKVQGNVSAGQFMIASATTGRAEQDGYTRGPGSIGMAVTSYAGGGAGTVNAILFVDLYLGASKGKGYVIGGVSNVAQILNFINETTSLTASANLSVARNMISGISGSGAGYSVGGWVAAANATVDKTAFATDITTAAAAMPAARARMSRNVFGNLAGYSMGGYVAAASLLTDKTTFSTDVTAAQASANLSLARYQSIAGFSSSLNGYALGGTTGAVSAVADKMPFATEITAAQASANLSLARSSIASVFSSTAGYALGGITGAVSAVADKMPFATETTAAQASANLSLARSLAAGLIGALAGYALGGSTGVDSVVADKLTYSTDTTAAVSGANLPTACSDASSLSTTNY